MVDPFQASSYPQTFLIDLSDGGYEMGPGEFLLASTLERVQLAPTLAARLEGKSSLGRLGMEVHSTAGFIDSGFGGYPTLEIQNKLHTPIKLRAGMPICQIAIFRMEGVVQQPYGHNGSSKYQDQGPHPQTSRYYMNPLPTGKPTIKEQ